MRTNKQILEQIKSALENSQPIPITQASMTITDLNKDKLQKYEAIEKEFGCPIDIVLHILKHKDIYVDRAYSHSFSDPDGTSFQKTINLGEACGRIHYDSIDKTFELIFNCWSIKLSDFGHTWARTKEEYLSISHPYDIYMTTPEQNKAEFLYTVGSEQTAINICSNHDNYFYIEPK